MSLWSKLREIVAAARIKPAVVQVESHPYLPEWELLDFCREHGIVLLAFAALGHGMDPKVLDDPVITAIAQRVHKTPAQVALAWAVQRGTAFLTTSTKPRRIQENFDISTLPEDAMREIRDGINDERPVQRCGGDRCARLHSAGSLNWARPLGCIRGKLRENLRANSQLSAEQRSKRMAKKRARQGDCAAHADGSPVRRPFEPWSRGSTQ